MVIQWRTTGLSCNLNNLCCLIEQIQQLKAENDRLRAHLELDDHLDKFQKRFLLKDTHKNQQILSSTTVHNEERSKTISPTSSLKSKQLKLNRQQKGKFLVLRNS